MFQGSEEGRNQSAALPDDVDALKGLITKARWAGMDHDAEKLCQELESRAPADCMIQGPFETD
jgi:hypothetical protein